MTAIQIPRRYMPGYRKPRVSPNRLCQIDWDNPLSRGLIVFMLPVPGGALDIVSGRFFSKNSSYSTVPDFGQLSRFNSSGGQSVEVLSNVGSWPSSPGITAGCVARYSAATVGSDDCMVDFRNDANTWRLKLTTQSPTGQSYRVFAKNSSSKSINYSGGPDPNDNQAHRVIASIGNNSDLRLDVDNVGVQTTSAGSGSPQIADDFKLGSDGGGGSFQGAIYCAYGFSRQLSETEMLALNANPWQLVKPLFPAIHFSVGGAAIVEAFVTYAAQLGQTMPADAVVEAQLSIANQVGLTAFADAVAEASANYAMQADYSAFYGLIIEAAVSSGIQMDTGFNSDVSAEAAFLSQLQMALSAGSDATAEAAYTNTILAGLTALSGAVAEGSMSAALLLDSQVMGEISIEAAITNAIAMGYTPTADAVAEAAAVNGIVAGFTSIGLVTAEANISISASPGFSVVGQVEAQAATEAALTFSMALSANKTAEATANASVSIDTDLAVAVVAEAAAQAGISVAQVLGVSFSGSIVSGSLVTPDGRVCTVQAGVRACVVDADPRNCTVK